MNNLWNFDINKFVNNYIDEFNDLLYNILKNNNPTFNNTFDLLNNYNITKNFDINRCIFLQYVTDDINLQELSSNAEKILSKFIIDLDMNLELYNLTKQIYNQEKTTLNKDDVYYLETYLRTFRRNGLDLDKIQQDKLKKLNNELSILCIDFSSNIERDNSKIYFTKDELNGLSDIFLNSLHFDNNKYELTSKYPHLFPILEKANNEETRRRMEEMYITRCKNNTQILYNIIQKRKEIANILGYKNWSEYVLEINMAKTENNVKKFLNDIYKILIPLRDTEIKRMTDIKGSKIYQHDCRYYIEKEKTEHYNIDNNVIKQYFPLEFVLENMFKYFDDLLHLSFIQNNNKNVWHNDVSEWLVYDRIEKKYMGTIYLDLFPRDNKFHHCACFPLKFSTLNSPNAICTIVCNFTKPHNNIPSLLTHHEVETLYHEFGHAMHNICSNTKFIDFSGTQTENDFVETPSQMLENWCWEFNTLKQITKHYITEESMSDEMINNLIATRYIYYGIENCKQIAVSLIDCLLHSEDIENIEEMYNISIEEIMGIPFIETDTNNLATFCHIAGGYDSQYYGYLWSKVYSDDLYKVLQYRLKTDKIAGLEYRKKVLELGGSIPGINILRNYLGREPKLDTFLENIPK
jgi:thimet oligopeptidase